MPKIQLTIKTTYLPSWKAYEGIREIIQNARDAEVEGHKLTVDWVNGTLRIENDGAVLPTKALLLGHTTKEGRSDQIGKFGEGLKLGVLALVRAGHPVKIRNGSEVWTPSIERSETFDEDVLTFKIEGGREEKKRVRIEISDIDKDVWEKMKSCFLFLQKPKKGTVIKTSSGSLLLADEHKNRLYVKGIFVQTHASLEYGYDLKDAELDRDRKMIEAWNLRWDTKNILLEALDKQDALLPKFVEMLENPTAEVESIQDANSSYAVLPETAKFVADSFRAKYGEDAVPVANLAESKDVEHLGKRGIVVNKQHGTVLAKVLGDALTVKETLKKEVLRSYSWGDLDVIERASLTDDIALVNPIEPITLDEIDIVDFRSDAMMGQFKNNRVIIAKKHLADADKALRIIVHEVAHRQGGDGDVHHSHRVEEIWMGIVAGMRRKSSS